MVDKKEIEKEIEELTAHIQKAFDVIKEKFGRAPCAEVIAYHLRLHRYRREGIVEKETAKAILNALLESCPQTYDELKVFVQRCAELYRVEVEV